MGWALGAAAFTGARLARPPIESSDSVANVRRSFSDGRSV